MSSLAPSTGPFFRRVSGDPGDAQRFCYFHAPAGATRGAVLAVHAFAEEMNKTRAAVAEGARALAAAGFAVLQVDLAGCGDSDGDFADASWDLWLADLADAWSWLAANATGPRWIWGTRLGALLADQFSARCTPVADGLLLWQPVSNGAQHLGQFLRLKTVNALLRDTSRESSSSASSSATSGTAVATTPVARVAQPSPRADLAAGRSIEVAGYRLTPGLADALEAARLGASAAGGDATRPPPRRVRWLEVSSQPEPALSPVATRIVERWRAAGSDVAVVHVTGSAFWQTQDVERCPALVAATVEAVAS